MHYVSANKCIPDFLHVVKDLVDKKETRNKRLETRDKGQETKDKGRFSWAWGAPAPHINKWRSM